MLLSNVSKSSSFSTFPACMNPNYRTDLSRFFQPATVVSACEDFKTAEPGVQNILIIEDEHPLARLLAKGLQTKDAAVYTVASVEEAAQQIEKMHFSVIVVSLDVTNAASAGQLQQVRSACPNAGVLVLTERGSVQDNVATLEHGADDYLSKPFSLLELAARVRALRRRTQLQVQPVVRRPELVLNFAEFRVERAGRVIDLTQREFALLAYLVNNPGKVLSRSILMHEVWNMPEDANTNIVDVYMKYLRDKLDAAGEESLIRTVRGVGYVFSRTN